MNDNGYFGAIVEISFLHDPGIPDVTETTIAPSIVTNMLISKLSVAIVKSVEKEEMLVTPPVFVPKKHSDNPCLSCARVPLLTSSGVRVNAASTGLAMIDSINGTFVNADLCLAVNNRLHLSSIFTIRGTGPFRSILFGLTQIEANLIKTIINMDPPYVVSVEIKNTAMWKDFAVNEFYIQIIDHFGNAGNVTIQVSQAEGWF